MREDENPFAAPDTEHKRKYRPERDPSVEHEPHLLGEEFLPDRSETTGSIAPIGERAAPADSVWDEPAFSQDLAGAVPDNAATYAHTLEERISSTSLTRSWVFAVLGGIVSGSIASVAFFPFNVLPRMWILAFHHGFGCLLTEALKATLAIYATERRPWLFKSTPQIFASMAISGLTCAVIGMMVGTRRFSFALDRTVFGSVHVLCSLGVGLGLSRVWSECMRDRRPPRISGAARWLCIAAAIHLLYVMLSG